MRFLWKVVGVTYLSSRWIVRQPQWLIQTVLASIGFLVLLYLWGGRAGIVNYIIGDLVAMSWSVGINIVGQHAGWYRLMNLMDAFIASETGPTSYILGVFLSSAPFILASLGVNLPIAIAFNCLKALAAAVIPSLAMLVLSTALGLAIAMRVRKGVNISAITNPISYILTVLPPVYYPAMLIPKTVAIAAMACPTAAAAELARALIGLSPIPAWIPIASLAAWVGASIALSKRAVRWGLF